MSIISDTYLEYALTGREDIDLCHNKIKKDNDLLDGIMATQQTFICSKSTINTL